MRREYCSFVSCTTNEFQSFPFSRYFQTWISYQFVNVWVWCSLLVFFLPWARFPAFRFLYSPLNYQFFFPLRFMQYVVFIIFLFSFLFSLAFLDRLIPGASCHFMFGTLRRETKQGYTSLSPFCKPKYYRTFVFHLYHLSLTCSHWSVSALRLVWWAWWWCVLLPGWSGLSHPPSDSLSP